MSTKTAAGLSSDMGIMKIMTSRGATPLFAAAVLGLARAANVTEKQVETGLFHGLRALAAHYTAAGDTPTGIELQLLAAGAQLGLRA